ncbi:MAG TPA: RNA polymerase sigma factor [Bacteroidaceae bacterium]|nr:RNA polymerase sigma factor [Bacteroidaceae bacterium]
MNLLPIFAQLTQVQQELRAYALYLTHDASFADDLLQEASIRAMSQIDQYQEQNKFLPWMKRIMRNMFYDRMRAEQKVSIQSLDEIDYLEDYAAMDSFQEPDNEEYDLSLLMSLLKALPDDKRELFGLYALKGVSYEDMAEIVGVPSGTVKSRLHRIKKELKTAYFKALKNTGK